MRIAHLAYSSRFKRERKRLDPQTRAALDAALRHLLQDPQPRQLRMHPLSGLPKPTVWKIDIYSNHS